MGAERRLRSIPELMKLALGHHRAGRLREAGARYKQILRLDPDHADALNFSGLVAHQKGQTEVAIALITRATRKDPRVASYFFNLGVVVETNGELDKAIVHYCEAASLDPGLRLAHNTLGNALMKRGKFSEAAVNYSRELSISPDSYETINNLGTALYRLGRFEQAIVCYRKAISLKATYAEAHNNLGVAFNHLGRWDEAVASYDQALCYKPAFPEAYSNLGDTHRSLGDFKKAVLCCQRAIELQPDYHIAYLHLGNAYKALGLLSEAVCSYQRAISLAPDDASAHCNLGNVYGRLGLLSEAVDSYQRAISLLPNSAAVHTNLAVSFRDQGKLQKAVESFHRALEARPVFTPAYSNLLYFYAFTRHISPAEERIIAEGWEKAVLTDGERIAARERAAPGRTFPGRSRSGRKLRLGIVSAELRQHSVAEFLEPFLEQLDRSRFALTLFPTALFSDSRSQGFRELAERNGDGFLPLCGLKDAQAAERIRSEQIDVLIETSGHTDSNRLGIFAHRAAPVQCSYIGYWSTTGLTEMDWFITDTGCDASFDAHFTEGLWRLPRLAHCYKGDPSLPQGGWAPDPEGTIWLGSFNNYSKIREETLGLWAKVLRALPEARLLFEDSGLQNEETRYRISSILAGLGIGESRIVFIPYFVGHERHMMLYDRLDIALDTIPFNSGTTAFDALWMGVPLVTLAGNWMGGSLSSSVLRAFDHPEWVAQDAEEYVSIVCSLARDVEGRKALRKSQRTRMAESPLCDARGMARALEDALETMYDRWIAGAQRTSPLSSE
jgi:protein O-GlcNAc transferase